MSKNNRPCQAKYPAACPHHGAKILQAKIDQLFNPPQTREFHEDYITSTYAPSFLPNAYREQAKAFQESITAEDKGAILSYVNTAYKFINLSLAKERDIETFPDYDKSVVSRLDSLFSRRPDTLVTPSTLYRGLRYDEALRSFGGLRKGQVFSPKVFQSTTANPLILHTFTNKSAPVILEIKGVNKALPISFLDHPHGFEEEYLLPRDSKFKFIKIHKNVQWNLTNEKNKSYSLQNVTIVELEALE